jgi:hypothetical protein
VRLRVKLPAKRDFPKINNFSGALPYPPMLPVSDHPPSALSRKNRRYTSGSVLRVGVEGENPRRPRR